MNIYQYAQRLAECGDYPDFEIPKELQQQAEREGVVVVTGASDDLTEFHGAIYDELGAYDGRVHFVTADGLDYGSKCDEGDDCPNYKPIPEENKIPLEALWCPQGNQGPSWAFEFPVQHATFNIMEEGEVYCVGIVFTMDDVRAAIRAKAVRHETRNPQTQALQGRRDAGPLPAGKQGCRQD